MKRTLILMRHAKTEDIRPGQRDFDRELLSRGEADAVKIAQIILAHCPRPELLLSSTAKRTRQTTGIFLEAAGNDPAIEVRNEQSLYHASSETILHEILSVPDHVHCLMLVGHNPGISDFAFECSRKMAVGMPTASVAVFSFDAPDWLHFGAAPKNLEHYFHP